MKAEAERRRPFAAAFALFVLICAGLVVPLLLSGTGADPSSGTVRAASTDSTTLTWPVPLLANSNIVLERGTVTLADASSGKSRGARLLALLTGGGANIILDDARVVIGRSEAIASASEPSPEAALDPVVAALVGLNFETLHLNRVTAVVRIAGRPDESLENLSGEVTKTRGGEITAKLEFWLRGEKLSLESSMSLHQDAADAPMPLRLSLSGKHLDLNLSGRVVSGERLQVKAQNAELKILNLRAAARWLDSDWPAGQGLGIFKASGPIILDERSIAFENAQFTLDGNRANGAVSLTLGRDRPAVEGTLAFESLDVAPYLSAQKTDVLSLAANWLANLRVPGTAQPSIVRALDADLRISARSVVVGSDRFGRCAASISIKAGKLLGELAEMELEQGGAGEGQIALDMTAPEPRYTLRASLRDVDMKGLAAHVGGLALEGSGDLSFDLTGEGGTAEELLSTLSGSVNLEMREGARLGFSIDSLKASTSETQAAAWGSLATGSTTVDTFIARFKASRGVFTAEDVAATSPNRVTTALGTVSAADRSLDMTISSAPPGPAPGPTKANDAEGNPSYRILGPWLAPLVTKVSPPGKSALPLVPTPSTPAPATPASVVDQGRG